MGDVYFPIRGQARLQAQITRLRPSPHQFAGPPSSHISTAHLHSTLHPTQDIKFTYLTRTHTPPHTTHDRHDSSSLIDLLFNIPSKRSYKSTRRLQKSEEKNTSIENQISQTHNPHNPPKRTINKVNNIQTSPNLPAPLNWLRKLGWVRSKSYFPHVYLRFDVSWQADQVWETHF